MIPDEREWQAQERAVHCERNGIEWVDSDPLNARYLAIARALRQPLNADLPADFASCMERLVDARSRIVLIESRLEQRLLLALALVFSVSALAAAVFYGSGWLAPVANLVGHAGPSALSWPAAALACLGVSWFTEQLRRQSAGPDQRNV